MHCMIRKQRGGNKPEKTNKLKQGIVQAMEITMVTQP